MIVMGLLGNVEVGDSLVRHEAKVKVNAISRCDFRMSGEENIYKMW